MKEIFDMLFVAILFLFTHIIPLGKFLSLTFYFFDKKSYFTLNLRQKHVSFETINYYSITSVIKCLFFLSKSQPLPFHFQSVSKKKVDPSLITSPWMYYSTDSSCHTSICTCIYTHTYIPHMCLKSLCKQFCTKIKRIFIFDTFLQA